jgi:signal transduction histidine kinase/CheY-like chemotaxis protein
MTSKASTTTEVIVPFGRDAEWLEARELVKNDGGLPSHRLHDDTLVNSDNWEILKQQGYYSPYGTWAKEVIVYPEPNGKFIKGRDVKDAFIDDRRRQWIFPSSAIPEIAIGKEAVALFVNPQDVEVGSKKVVISSPPESITVLTRFMQKDGWGKVDEETRIPLKANLALVPSGEQRYLWRINGRGVRPLARGVNDFGISGRDVFALRRPVHKLGVASVQAGYKQAAFTRPITPKIIAPLLVEAKTNHEELLRSGILNHDQIRPYEALFRALERCCEALITAQRTEAVAHLAGGVAHDFNNLLTVIIGNLELLERQGNRDRIDTGAARLIASAQQAAEQGAVLTGRLLAFSRRQAFAPRIIAITGLVAAASDLLRRTLGEHIRLETLLAGGLWSTRVDPQELQSALLNLAINARDAMRDGGKLTIETSNSYLDKAYAAANSDVTPGQYVLLSITDTGTGMTPETLERAIEPFFTTKQEGEGTGLGLSQVHAFIKRSGGHLKLNSEPGAGTTVKLYLPRYHDAEALETKPPESPVTARSTEVSHAVLLVEDDPNVREFSHNALEYLGYRVYQAADAPAALELLARRPDIRLLFADVGLPGMNGRQLAEAATRHAPNLKILFTTGYARNAIIHTGILDFRVELLTKPFTVAALGRKLSEMLRDDR